MLDFRDMDIHQFCSAGLVYGIFCNVEWCIRKP